MEAELTAVLSSDRLSIFFAGIILLVSVPSVMHAVGYLRGHYAPAKIARALGLMAVFILSLLAVVTAANAFLFLVAWEIMSLVSYFLVVFDSDDERSVKAGMVYVIMTHIGTAFITAAFLILYSRSGSFDFPALSAAAAAFDPATRNLLFFLFLIGFGTKAGIVPLHVWLPYAHPQAPSPVSAMMSGVMIKTAVYGLIRFLFGIVGIGAWWWGNVVMALAAASCLIGIIYALMEHDIKRLLAYSSVENMGIILLGIGASMIFLKTGMPLVALLALSAGLYHALNHAIFKSLLFLGAGNIFKATGLRDMEKLGGLIRRMPWTAAAFLTGAMAIAALPPLNGFVSEWLTLQALFLGAVSGTKEITILMGIYASALALTGGLAAACFVKAFGIIFLAQPRGTDAQKAEEVPASMYLPVLFLAACTVAFGLGAVPVLNFLSRVAADVTGIPLEGAAFALNNFTLVPRPGGTVVLSPVQIAVLLGAAVLAVFAGMRMFGTRPRRVAAPTWGCGYYELTPRTEYTATAFSKPLRIVFGFLLQPYRRTEEIRESRYHIRSMKFETRTTPVIKHYFYDAALKVVMRTAHLMRTLQMGSIHIYIAYIFLTILALIIFL